MKIFQAIAIFDYCVVAETSEDARETLNKWITGFGGAETPISFTELTATEIREEREIRRAMREVPPLVGDTVTDDDFTKLVKGTTNLRVFEKLHTKTVK